MMEYLKSLTGYGFLDNVLASLLAGGLSSLLYGYLFLTFLHEIAFKIKHRNVPFGVPAEEEERHRDVDWKIYLPRGRHILYLSVWPRWMQHSISHFTLRPVKRSWPWVWRFRNVTNPPLRIERVSLFDPQGQVPEFCDSPDRGWGGRIVTFSAPFERSPDQGIYMTVELTRSHFITPYARLRASPPRGVPPWRGEVSPIGSGG